jgi:hypothetical protein
MLSAMAGLRDALFGLALVLGLNEVRLTRLFQNFDAIWPGVTGPGIGWLLLLAGIFVAASSFRGKYKWANTSLKFQGLIWLFSCLMYFASGYYVLGVVFGLAFCLHSWYLAYLKTDRLTVKHRHKGVRLHRWGWRGADFNLKR